MSSRAAVGNHRIAARRGVDSHHGVRRRGAAIGNRARGIGGGIGHARQGVQHVLDLAGRNVVAARVDHLVQSTGTGAPPRVRAPEITKLFEPEPKKPRHIQSVRGVGYRFVP